MVTVMVTIHGAARKEGIATAVVAVVDARLGVSGVSPKLLQEGLGAIRRMASPVDYPESVVVCETLAMGASVRMPGINVIGIAAQSEADVPGLAPDVPCVIGLADLLVSVSHGDIIIVDGNKGLVHIDPDPQTIMHYQEIEERHAAKPPVYIESEHIPARTQHGETVMVYALAEGKADLERALDAGADGMVVSVPERAPSGFYEAVLSMAAGKPVVFATAFPEMDLLRAAMHYASPMQVSVAMPARDFEALSEEAAKAMESVAVEAYLNDLDPPQVALGMLARAEQMAEGSLALVIDARGQDVPGGLELGEVALIIDGPDDLPRVVEMGARKVAVAPESVAECKYRIRCIGMEDEE